MLKGSGFLDLPKAPYIEKQFNSNQRGIKKYIKYRGFHGKKGPIATCALRDRWIDSIERVYTPSTFYMKSAVLHSPALHRLTRLIQEGFVPITAQSSFVVMYV